MLIFFFFPLVVFLSTFSKQPTLTSQTPSPLTTKNKISKHNFETLGTALSESSSSQEPKPKAAPVVPVIEQSSTGQQIQDPVAKIAPQPSPQKIVQATPPHPVKSAASPVEVFKPTPTVAQQSPKKTIHQEIKTAPPGMKPASQPLPQPTPQQKPQPAPQATPRQKPQPAPQATPQQKPQPTPQATPQQKPQPTPQPKPQPTPQSTPQLPRIETQGQASKAVPDAVIPATQVAPAAASQPEKQAAEKIVIAPSVQGTAPVELDKCSTEPQSVTPEMRECDQADQSNVQQQQVGEEI